MGLPRYLKEKEKEWLRVSNKNEAVPFDLYFIVQDYLVKSKYFDYRNRKNIETEIVRHAIKSKYKLLKIYNEEFKESYKTVYEFQYFLDKTDDSKILLENNQVIDFNELYYPENEEWYRTLNNIRRGDKHLYHALYKKREIKRKYASVVDKKNIRNYDFHLELANSNLKVYKYKYWKNIESRMYKGTLRQLIFERDNFSCQLCGIHRDEAIKKGLHLEIDHITEWEDGGKTTYENGQTLCSECNKAKFRVKRLQTA
jgi:hypothetical protein